MATEIIDWVGLELAGGRYQIVAPLGEGGMAFIYRARDRTLDTDVVIKVPRSAMLGDTAFAGRFAREVRSLVRLVHPHIVRVHDVGEHEGTPYAVMQYLSGGSLRDRQSAVGFDGKPLPMPPDELCTWLEDVAAALDFIHQQGYVHRDVKPDNVLFDAHGNAYLSDFGVAKVLADNRPMSQRTVLTGGGFIFGTPHYMAPELLLGHAYDGRVDQYALAVMVYELLSGRYPFDGATPAAILVQQTSRLPQSLDELLPAFPKAAAVAVQQGLLIEPDKRYPNCTAFARAVLQGLGETSILASPPPSSASAPATLAVQEGMTTVTCPGCEMVFRLPIQARGKRLRCGSCRRVFRISPSVVSGPGARPPVAAASQATPATAASSPAAATNTSMSPVVQPVADTQTREGEPTGQDRWPGSDPSDAERSPEDRELEELRQAVFLNRLRKLHQLHNQVPGTLTTLLALVAGTVGGILVGVWTADKAHAGLAVAMGVLTLLTILWVLLWLYPFLCGRAVRITIEEIISQYPAEVRRWGGWPVLRDALVVQELIRILEKRK